MFIVRLSKTLTMKPLIIGSRGAGRCALANFMKSPTHSTLMSGKSVVRKIGLRPTSRGAGDCGLPVAGGETGDGWPTAAAERHARFTIFGEFELDVSLSVLYQPAQGCEGVDLDGWY